MGSEQIEITNPRAPLLGEACALYAWACPFLRCRSAKSWARSRTRRRPLQSSLRIDNGIAAVPRMGVHQSAPPHTLPGSSRPSSPAQRLRPPACPALTVQEWTVIKTITKYVVGDFTWKDPIAAQRAGMSLKDYVVRGMDRGF